MTGIKRLEDLIAWEKARELTRQVYGFTRRSAIAGDRGLAAHMQRASVSVMSNVSEGFESGTSTQFQRFLSIARASCAEVRCQTYVALDCGYVTDTEAKPLLTQAEEVSRLIFGLWASLRNRGHPSP